MCISMRCETGATLGCVFPECVGGGGRGEECATIRQNSFLAYALRICVHMACGIIMDIYIYVCIHMFIDVCKGMHVYI